MTKKTVWPNQGHVVRDIYVDEINRVYVDGSNLLVVLGATTGLETHDSVIKNEAVRLIVPILAASKLSTDLMSATNQLISSNEIPSEDVSEQSKNKNSEVLGKAFRFET